MTTTKKCHLKCSHLETFVVEKCSPVMKFEKAQFSNNGVILLYIAREGSGSCKKGPDPDPEPCLNRIKDGTVRYHHFSDRQVQVEDSRQYLHRWALSGLYVIRNIGLKNIDKVLGKIM